MLELLTLIHQCAPASVSPDTLQAIIHTESADNPLALNVNGRMRLQYQPKSRDDAIGWSMWLIKRGYSIDMGLMQINSRQLARFNMTAADAFDACKNIRTGAAILTEHYSRATQTHGQGREALLHAISAYNTGNFEGGFRNGYVARVMTNTSSTTPAAAAVDLPVNMPVDLSCLLGPGCSGSAAGRVQPLDSGVQPIKPETVDTGIGGFEITRAP